MEGGGGEVMYKIIIVDDEAIERQAIQKMLETSSQSISIIGEARNGREAIQLASSLKPDIMMMDIKMPGVSGLEAVQQIKQDQPKIKFIMVSAYDTFDYAREAMREGVKEYILKPSRKEDILSSIQRVINELDQERLRDEQAEDIKEKFSQALSIMKSEWVISLLMSHIQEINQEDWLSLLDLDMVDGCAIAISVVSHEDYPSSILKQKWYSVIKEWLSNKQGCIVGAMIGDQIPVFMFGQKDSRIPLKALVLKRLQELRNVIRIKQLNVSIQAGIGRNYQELQELVTSYHEAVLALEHVEGDGFFRHFDDLKRNDQNQNLYEDERDLLELVKDGNIEKATHALEAYIDKLIENQTYSNASLYQQLNDFFVILTRMLHDLGIKSIPQRPTMAEHQSNEELKQVAVKMVYQITLVVKSWRDTQDVSLLDKAQAYVESHYNDNLTLQFVADYVGLSLYYFSKRFKEHTGLNFIDYLTTVRIDKAKLLLKRTDQSLKEICFNIGYKDPNYFSRVFKKMTSVSPTEFRKHSR